MQRLDQILSNGSVLFEDIQTIIATCIPFSNAQYKEGSINDDVKYTKILSCVYVLNHEMFSKKLCLEAKRLYYKLIFFIHILITLLFIINIFVIIYLVYHD